MPAWQEPKWFTPPAQCESGDILLGLASGPPPRAHSMYLQHASPVFKDMLASTSAAARACLETSPSSQDPGQDDGQGDSQAA